MRNFFLRFLNAKRLGKTNRGIYKSKTIFINLFIFRIPRSINSINGNQEIHHVAPPQGHINPPQLHQHHHHHAASNQVSTRPRPSPKTGNKTFNKSPNKKIASTIKHPPDKNSGSTIPALINKPQPLISVVPLIPHGVQQQQQQHHHLHQQQHQQQQQQQQQQ